MILLIHVCRTFFHNNNNSWPLCRKALSICFHGTLSVANICPFFIRTCLSGFELITISFLYTAQYCEDETRPGSIKSIKTMNATLRPIHTHLNQKATGTIRIRYWEDFYSICNNVVKKMFFHKEIELNWLKNHEIIEKKVIKQN